MQATATQYGRAVEESSSDAPKRTAERAVFRAQAAALLLRSDPRVEETGRTIGFVFDTPSIRGQMMALDGEKQLTWETPDVAEIAE